MNKKKIILISSVALVLILITIICVVIFGKDKNTSKDNNETTSKVTEVTSTEADTETNSETETESSSEVESTTQETTTEESTTVEQPSTEAPTEKPVEKPTETPTTSKTEKPTLSLEEAAKLTPSGSYTEYKFQLGPEYGDALNGYVIVRKTYENGAVRDYLIVDGEECELDSPIGVVPDDYVPNSSNSVGVHTGQQQTQSQKSDEEITKEREEWLKENFGDKFTCNGMEFVYNKTYEKFCTTRKTSYLHLITSTTTSTIGYNYQIEYYPFLADYLGYTGTDNRPAYYNNTKTFDYPRTLETGSTVTDVESTNKAFLKQLGWEEPIPVGDEICGWDYISTDGVPITVERDGYLYIYIKYSADETYSEYSFTIEEYNEFIATHTWTVRSEHIYVSWYESEPDLVIRKYLQVE